VAAQAKVEVLAQQRRIGEADLRGALQNPDQNAEAGASSSRRIPNGNGRRAYQHQPAGRGDRPGGPPERSPPRSRTISCPRAVDLLHGIALYKTSPGELTSDSRSEPAGRNQCRDDARRSRSPAYRRGVGMMLLNALGDVFVAQRIDMPSDAWQKCPRAAWMPARRRSPPPGAKWGGDRDACKRF